MENKTIKNLIAIGTLAVLLMSSHNAFAYVPGVWDPQPHSTNVEPAFRDIPVGYDIPVEPQTTQTVYVNQAPQPKPKVVATNTTVQRTIVSTNRNQNTYTPSNNTTYTDQNNQPNNNYPYNNPNQYNNSNQLTALSVNGNGGFMPSSVWQWLVVIFLILVIIIIARMLGRKPEHHEVHTVTGH